MDSNEDHFTYAMQLVTSTSLTMVLVNAIKLKVLEAIAKAGPDARLSAYEIAFRLSIPNKDAPNMLDWMLRLLASHSIVTCTQSCHNLSPVRVYGLAPVAKYFIGSKDGVSLGTFMELYQDDVCMHTWSKLKDSVLEGGVAFDKLYGRHLFEYPAIDARFNDVFNNAMVNHTTIVINEILDCYHGFENLKRLVDVGGGIEHIGGDMFQEVPHGDAIFMKWILHDCQCVKLLSNCYKALPHDGIVIVVEAVLPFLSDTSSSVKVTTHMDTMMMTQCPGGKERTDEEFLALDKDAGFTGIRKQCFVCNLSKLKDSVLEGGISFDKVYGIHAFEYPAVDARFNNVFNNAMVNHTTIVIKELLKCYHSFENLKQLVDVGGGLGITLNMIVLKHPTVKGINFDLPHVIRHAPVYPGIEHIGGDMFQEVPHGDAIFMKWILHDWSDVQCVKHTSSSIKATTHLDAMMMTQNPGGKERTDEEFLALAKDAGFGGIRKSCFLKVLDTIAEVGTDVWLSAYEIVSRLSISQIRMHQTCLTGCLDCSQAIPLSLALNRTNNIMSPNQVYGLAPVPNMLDRMIRLLASYSIVTCTQQDE
ncbi:O-methyltransferase COMT-type, S-adenosyl-L-methionine-dependent methyltransferase [Artemisia annua]|uniref:O-methyltransferase COMT-type, S-adenosyl-L-methionine-dependent methyltransferase n=1 Tax=Artemisia annua TaxID=35608 RepID=A0A2U1NWV6_ARTAN|nr:O-methyltransferase COMT-type, S-adenosyl-L-methionine-dependent methyltransferase [Artemisia annua]